MKVIYLFFAFIPKFSEHYVDRRGCAVTNNNAIEDSI